MAMEVVHRLPIVRISNQVVGLVLFLLVVLLVGGAEGSVLAPPPFNSSWEEWLEKMPLPLKKDFQIYINEGEGKIDWTLTCECANISNDRFSYLFHNGSFWFPNENPSLKMRMDKKFFMSLGRSITERHGILPSVKMYMDTMPEGNESVSVCPCNPHYPPLFVLSKKEEEKRFIRRPTMYIVPGWAREALVLYEERVPWEEKIEQVFYKGEVASDKGSLPRLIALIFQSKLKEKIPELGKLFSLSCAGECPGKSEVVKALTKVNTKTFQREQMPWTGAKEFSKYKYNLHLPGHFTAGYSRALQFLLPQLTVPLFWDNPYREYYYDWLVEGKHYLTVKPENLVQTVLWLKNHDNEAKQFCVKSSLPHITPPPLSIAHFVYRIAENGNRFVFDKLQFDDIQNYWEWLLLTYIRLSANKGPPDVSKGIPQGTCAFFKGTHKVYKRENLFSSSGVVFIDPILDSIIDGLRNHTLTTATTTTWRNNSKRSGP